MVASSAEGGENSQSSQEEKKLASNTLGASSDAATATWSAQANGNVKESEESMTEQAEEGEQNPVLEIPLNSFDLSWLKNDLQRVDCLEQYEQLASYVWRVSADGPVLVVPGTPPALVAWEGGLLLADKETPATTAHLLDRVLSPESSEEPVLRALTVCFFA